MDCRKNIYTLTDAELANFITAVNGLKASGVYDTFIHRHYDAMNMATGLAGEPPTSRNAAHRGPSFAPWHRYFLREFELALQTVVPGVAVPYWDWAADAANPLAAPLFNTNPSARIYIGGDGTAPNDRVTSGPFAGWIALIDAGGTLVPRPGAPGLVRRLARDPQAAGGNPVFPTAAQVSALLNVTSFPTYDSTPWSESQSTTPSFRNRAEGWLRTTGEAGSQLHNRIHLWVGGDMLPGTSPNDPVFFLHHCNIDRLWAKWQSLSPATPWAPVTGGPPGHNLNDVMGALTTANATPANSFDYRKNLGYMYDDDLPIVELVAPAVTFNDVPVGETTYRAAVFHLYCCEPVHLEIKPGFGPSAPYGLTALGGSTIVYPSAGPLDVGRIWFQFTGAAAPGAAPSGTAVIRCVETGQEFTVNLSANTIARPTVAVVLALDQSGSMAAAAGTGVTRIQVLHEAGARFAELVQAGNGVGLVRFDHDAYPVLPVSTIGAGPADPNRVAVANAVQATAPAGATSIGDGVELARTALAGVSGYDAEAILVFTDGLENTSKFLSDVAGSIDNRTFAIGLGTAQQVSAAALTTLTNGTGGYLLLSGQLLPNTDDYFRVSKYFLQILASVTNTNVVVDPSGTVAPGMRLRLPFALAETDIETTAILLTDLPVARLRREAPTGNVIDPAGAAALGATHTVGTNMQFYRVELPVPFGASAAHQGTWYALVDVDARRYKRALARLERGTVEHARLQAHGVRYSFVAHALSNLRMDARLAQTGLEPGATMLLRASLTEYGIPVERRARVRAEVSRPDGTTGQINLVEVGPGEFEAAVVAALSGVFRFRVLADGRTLGGTSFTREQVLTGAVVVGGDRPPVRDGERGEEAERLCRLLFCLLDDGKLGRVLREQGIEADALRECIERYCRDAAEPRPERG